MLSIGYGSITRPPTGNWAKHHGRSGKNPARHRALVRPVLTKKTPFGGASINNKNKQNMETQHNQDFHSALAVCKDIYEQSVSGLDAEIKRLQEQRKLVEEDYKKRRQAINQEFNKPTEKSVASRRRQQAFNIKRFIGGKLCEWESPVIDGTQAQVQFEMQEDQISMSVTIPYKPYEFPKH